MNALDRTRIAEADRHALSVLVVDDEAWLAEELADGMGSAGIAARIVHSAAEALAVLATDATIGVVVTDLRMPGQDGLSLARHLIEGRRPEHALKLVVMTGHATIDDAAAAVRTGVFDFLRKPFALDEMLSAVTKALDAARRERCEAVSRHAAASRLAMAEAETASLRDRDPETGLPDRAAFLSCLATLSAEGGALVLGLDRMGAVAEGAGRGMLADILAKVAGRLRATVPADALLARTGDAEFGVAMPMLTDALARQLGLAMLQAIAMPIASHGHTILPTGHVGFALAAAIGATPADAATQVALGAARRGGHTRVVGFTPAMHDAAARRLRLEQDLHRAIGLGGIRLHFQPIANPVDRRAFAFEALMRWRHPELGTISPGEFIPLAEENGSILDLGALAVAEAARQAAAWRGWIEAGHYISVNVSARQLVNMDLPALFAAALRGEGLPASALVCELTETLAADEEARPVLRELRAMGVRIALDDFGVGYSSLGMLRRLPVDLAKLDRSLIVEGAKDASGRQLLIGMANVISALGLKVVAEGVETEEQFALACAAGCTGVQGYLLSPPLAAKDATDFIAAQTG